MSLLEIQVAGTIPVLSFKLSLIKGMRQRIFPLLSLRQMHLKQQRLQVAIGCVSGSDQAAIGLTPGDWFELRGTSEDRGSIGVSSENQKRKRSDWRRRSLQQGFGAGWQRSGAG